jgi:glycerophosphoryl diester phosphodiesterase
MTYGFAHRGGGHGPDNALSTFVDALARGATGLETDAWLSLDGAVVLDHDGVATLPNGRVPISAVRRADLPANLATLDALYEECGTDFDLAVDVKTEAVASALVAVANRYAAADRLWVVAPAASMLAGVGGAHRATTVRGNVLRSRGRGSVLRAAGDFGVEAINARWMWWNGAIAAEVHALGMLAFGYDAQRRASLARSVGIGLDGVFSDNVEAMSAAIGATG